MTATATYTGTEPTSWTNQGTFASSNDALIIDYRTGDSWRTFNSPSVICYACHIPKPQPDPEELSRLANIDWERQTWQLQEYRARIPEPPIQRQFLRRKMMFSLSGWLLPVGKRKRVGDA